MRIQLLALLAMLLGVGGEASAAERELTFVHINDVYELQPRNGLGGMAPLATILDRLRKDDERLVLALGGDLLSPSLLSGIVYGKQMVEAMNALRLDVAVPGNHEFDAGPENFFKQIKESQATWLASNLVMKSGAPLPVVKKELIREINGVKVGFFGLITPTTANTSQPGPELDFLPVMEVARREVELLRSQGAEVVVALTHLLLDEDRQLAEEVEGIDLILGGHDHDPSSNLENEGTLILKSGSDAQYVGVVRMFPREGSERAGWNYAWEMRPVTGVAPQAAMQALVERWQKFLDSELGQPLVTVEAPFTSLENDVRTRENPLGNLVADAMLAGVRADLALINGGGLRGNREYAAGYRFTAKDILSELPFSNVTVLIELSGRDLLAVLENSFSMSEKNNSSGRYPHVAGMSVRFDARKPVGQRVVEVTVGGTPLELERKYKLATTDYLYSGKDGYEVLRKGRLLIDPSGARLVANHVKEWLLAHPRWEPVLEGRTQPVP